MLGRLGSAPGWIRTLLKRHASTEPWPEPPAPKAVRRGVRHRLLVLGLFGAAAACRPTATESPSSRPEGAIGWIDAPLLGDDVGAARELQTRAQQGLQGRLVRLDRLVDLFDAARFGEDEYARETLWTALGGHPVGVGSEATRDATARLLELALALDSAGRDSGGLTAAELDLLAEMIMLLSADLERPASAEGLSIATSAYRQLVTQGHARVADNARWRLYDHARGTLEGATQAAPSERLDVAVQALYADQESVEPWLAGGSEAPPPPSADELWGVVERHRAVLAQTPRWAPIVRLRAPEDETLRDTLRSVLPARREVSWSAPSVDAGHARPDAGAPVVRVEAGVARVDAGRPQARSVRLASDSGDPAEALERALAGTVSADGRGTILLVVAPDLPAPQLKTVLRAVRRAQISRVDVAVQESTPDGSSRLRSLPLVVARSSDGTQEMAALRRARVSVHLSGRGATLAADDRLLQADTSRISKMRRWADTLAAAYPTERAVRLTLGPDVSVTQLVELIDVLLGGPSPRFNAVGWWAGGAPVAGPARAAHDARVENRAALAGATVTLRQPYTLKDPDQARLDTFAQQLRECMPELETLPTGAATIGVSFDDGRLVDVRPPKVRASKSRLNAFIECAESASLGLRLTHHQDRIDIQARVVLDEE